MREAVLGLRVLGIAGSLAAVVALFLPWFDRSLEPIGRFQVAESLGSTSGWSSFAWLDIALAFLAGLSGLMLAGTFVAPDRRWLSVGGAACALGGVVLTVVMLVTPPNEERGQVEAQGQFLTDVTSSSSAAAGGFVAAAGLGLAFVGALAAAWVDSSPRRKTCPDCAERVRPDASVCRFCGYRF